MISLGWQSGSRDAGGHISSQQHRNCSNNLCKLVQDVFWDIYPSGHILPVVVKPEYNKLNIHSDHIEYDNNSSMMLNLILRSPEMLMIIFFHPTGDMEGQTHLPVAKAFHFNQHFSLPN